MNIQIAEKSKQKQPQKEIPNYLIYEMTSKGEPIYYRGYKEVLEGKKTKEDIMGDSTLQSWVKTRLAIILSGFLESKGYEILVGELGVKMESKGYRAADVAIFKRSELILNKNYAENAPEVIIEIDVQADTDKVDGDMKYIREKVDAYLEKGVKKVIWVFTGAEIVVVSTEKGKWQVEGWEKDVETIPGAIINIADMLEQRRNIPVE